jgi:hypothetical protein
VRRLAVSGAAVVLVAAFALADVQTTSARPSSDDLLRITSQVTYVVRPDDGPVHVTWQVTLENNDPTTQARDSGTSYFYQSIGLPVLRGASAVRAVGPGGGLLGTEIDDSTEGPTESAIVYFDRALYYGQDYTFTLSYDLVDTRSEVLLVTAAYVYLPAIVVGDSATVRIALPDDREWAVTLDPFDCAESAPAEYACGPSEGIQVAAWVEVSNPDALQSTDSAVRLANGEIALTISHFPDEERWASRIQTLSDAALPVLEGLFGFPYQGPNNLTIAERGRQDIAGYEGIFGCLADSCTIGISPIASDSTALHELAHLWTEMFEKRWLAEGLAEFMADHAAADLAGLMTAQENSPPPRVVDLYLDEWGPTRYIIGASDDELARENTGYWESQRFFQTLEEMIGLSSLQATNAAAADLGRSIDSQTYLDLLEEVTGERLDGLFQERVFPPSYAPVLEQRRQARERLVALQAAVAEAGLDLRGRIEQLVDEWSFESADRDMDEAEAAIIAYTAARDRIDEPRSLWERIGLWGEDPGGKLAAAAAEFSVGRFVNAADRAEAAQKALDGAQRAGQVRTLGALAALASVAVVASGSIWFIRRRRSAR